MHRAPRWLIAAATAIALGVPATIASAEAPSTTRPEATRRAVPDGLKIDGPRAESSRAPRPVIVRLAADPLAVVVGRAAEAGRTLDRAQRARAALAVVEAQATASAAAVKAGATVTRRYTHALNGFAMVATPRQIRTLAARPEVASVRPVRRVERLDTNSNTFTGAARTWTAAGATGRGVSIAVIDTGIDYTHAAFGGVGTTDAYLANDGTIVEPGSFPTAKVVGGYDFVGDDYTADGDGGPGDTPQPDPDPLDCEGHGTHVAGTAAGFGVTAAGATYGGPYTQAAVDAAQLRIGPGSAPKASLLAYRVFGCAGGAFTDVIVAAIDQAVADDADVINMSLGSTWGRADDPDAIAADNAMLAGTMVVMAAGNERHAPYQVGGPSTSKLGLSVAAMDATSTFPGATIDPQGAELTAINANGAGLPASGVVDVVEDGEAISLGCSVDDFGDVTGKIAVVERGVCARVDKVVAGQEAGAAAVVMINNGPGLPPFEGAVPGVTIPFLGLDPADADALVALDGESTTVVAAGPVDNPGYTLPASFSSGGPRSIDGGSKPDVMAPGVGVFSAAVATGSGEASSSGTSMAAPHVAGIAALVKSAHPRFGPIRIKNAIVSTASRDAALLGDDDMRLSGNGVVWAPAAVRTMQVLTSGGGSGAVNFGFRELDGGYRKALYARLRNNATSPVTYALTTAFSGDDLGANVSVSPRSITVPAKDYVQFKVTLTLSEQDAAAIPVDVFGDGLALVTGRILARSTAGGGERLSLPFSLVPRPRADVTAEFSRAAAAARTEGTVEVSNDGFVDGTFDLYGLLLVDDEGDGGRADARALGAQFLDPALVGFEEGTGDMWVNLAFATHGRFSNPADTYWEAALDTDGDGDADSLIILADFGLLTGGDPDGDLVTFVVDVATDEIVSIWDAIAPLDGSVVIGGFLASEVGITPESGSADVVGAGVQNWAEGEVFDTFDDVASINPFDPQVSQGDFLVLGPGESATVDVAMRDATVDEIPALGWMGVTLENPAGAAQAAVFGTPADE